MRIMGLLLRLSRRIGSDALLGPIDVSNAVMTSMLTLVEEWVSLGYYLTSVRGQTHEAVQGSMKCRRARQRSSLAEEGKSCQTSVTGAGRLLCSVKGHLSRAVKSASPGV